MKWRCYAQTGGVEDSKFCLFSVVFPVRCISSVSPRFYFRRHAFCFLLLAAILESLNYLIYFLLCFFFYKIGEQEDEQFLSRDGGEGWHLGKEVAGKGVGG
jgi:hypothetical protein